MLCLSSVRRERDGRSRFLGCVWRVAEQDIIAAREEVAHTRPLGTEQLAAAPHEVAAVDAAW